MPDWFINLWEFAGGVLKQLPPFASFTANIMTIIASGIAIYLYVAKRQSISNVFHLLLNYSYQITLSELRLKLDKLNDLDADNEDQCAEIINIFSDITGQIRGNTVLSDHFDEMMDRLKSFSSSKKTLTEARKRGFVSELRERIRHLDIKNIEGIAGERK